jgi:hypothetical protein
VQVVDKKPEFNESDDLKMNLNIRVNKFSIGLL